MELEEYKKRSTLLTVTTSNMTRRGKSLAIDVMFQGLTAANRTV
jgi:hypothetical protein